MPRKYRIAPPWVRTAATPNIAKRARFAAILKRLAEPAPLHPGVKPESIADRAIRLRNAAMK